MQSLSKYVETINSLFQHTDYISVEKLIISPKISRIGVDRYKYLLGLGIGLPPVRVFKHPNEEKYAVLDGNHKAQAQKEWGILEIECMVHQDPIGILYFLTEQGVLQPPTAFTDYIRIPIKRAMENL